MGKKGGELSLLLSPSVIGGIDGAFSFLRDYPYSCWEQKLSRGVMAALYGPLKAYLPQDFSWPDSDQAVRETLALAAEYQAPNGGMTFYQPRDEYVSPYLSAYTALAFNRLRQEGYLASGQVEQRLQDYLQNLLRHDAVPAEFSSGMTATVRAVALAALAERGKLALADVLRYRRSCRLMNLFGKALYLRALLAAGGSPGQQWEVLDALLAHADRSSGQIMFRESLDSGFQALLSSPTRDNAAILGGTPRLAEGESRRYREAGAGGEPHAHPDGKPQGQKPLAIHPGKHLHGGGAGRFRQTLRRTSAGYAGDRQARSGCPWLRPFHRFHRPASGLHPAAIE